MIRQLTNYRKSLRKILDTTIHQTVGLNRYRFLYKLTPKNKKTKKNDAIKLLARKNIVLFTNWQKK
jgi:hypothetical protein